jgi:hypothetical protein|tara:strand:- start:2583 stop:2831 length:249 start_codon:yes stop_codon:yes gene_type:complete
MFKKILKGIWTFSLEKGWKFVWSKTDIDEKAIEVASEVSRRAKNVKEELKDIGEELKDAVDQVDDVVRAIKGNSRPGRKPKK